MAARSRLSERAFAMTSIIILLERKMQWSDSRKSGSVTFTSCKPFPLVFTDVKIPFEPSQFGGDGTEIRRSICFSDVAADVRKQHADMEESIGATSLCIRDEFVRCKINMEKVRCFDESRKIVDAPKEWRGLNASARVSIKGKWATKQSSGLSLEVTDIQLSRAREEPCPF